MQYPVYNEDRLARTYIPCLGQTRTKSHTLPCLGQRGQEPYPVQACVGHIREYPPPLLPGARVKFEPESSSSHESSSSQVKKYVVFLTFILSSFSFDCDYCFHNVAPTAAQNNNSPRYITYLTACKLFIVKASEESL